MAGIYGNNVQLQQFGDYTLYGAAPDGTYRPGAVCEFFVSFDPVGAGCDSNGFCNPGAQITWTVNGTQTQTNVWTANDESVGGYIATLRTTAPQSGTMVVTATSQNTITFNVTVSATDTSAGSCTISELQCYDPTTNMAANCACGQYSAGNLTIWFYATPTVLGNGTAYYNVLVNGSVVNSISPGVVDTNQGAAAYNVDVPCPSGAATITIQGINGDSGGSISYTPGDNSSPGLDPGSVCANPCTSSYCDSTGSWWVCSNGCAVRSGQTCTPSGTGGNTGGDTGGNTGTGTDVVAQLTTFYNNNKKACLVGGALAIGLLIVGSRRKPDGY